MVDYTSIYRVDDKRPDGYDEGLQSNVVWQATYVLWTNEDYETNFQFRLRARQPGLVTMVQGIYMENFKIVLGG